MTDRHYTPREGDLYRVYQIDGHTFTISYGYYDDSERGRVEPLPIFPDLKTNEIYTVEGERIVTSLQKPCEYYTPGDAQRPEGWCGDCSCYSGGDAEMGVCIRAENKGSQYKQQELYVL